MRSNEFGVIHENTRVHTIHSEDLIRIFTAENNSNEIPIKIIEPPIRYYVGAIDVCTLADNMIAVVTWNGRIGILVLSDFHCIISSDAHASGITTDCEKNLYFTMMNRDGIHGTVVKTDFFLNRKTEDNSFDIERPGGLCYRNDMVFVCNQQNKSLLLLSSDLILITHLELDPLYFSVFEVKVVSNTIAISSLKILQFFHMEKDNVKNKIKFLEGRRYIRMSKGINAIYDGFCQIERHGWKNTENKGPILYIYDRNGIVTRTIILEYIYRNYFISSCDGIFFTFRGNIFVTSYMFKMLRLDDPLLNPKSKFDFLTLNYRQK